VITASRPGGAVRFPSGRIQQYTVSRQGYPQQDKVYVLFLKRDEEADYSIQTGYEVVAGELQIWGVLTNSLLQLTFEVIDPGRITSLTLVIFLDMKLLFILHSRMKSSLCHKGDWMTEGNLGQFEELVLRAVFALHDEAYGAKIRKTVADATDREVSIGAVYATLDRLERKGYITSWQGEATAKRGNRVKRYFRIEGSGEKVLKRAEGARKKIMKLAIA